MLVQDILRSPVHTIAPSDTLSAAYQAMREHGVRHLPVVDDGRLVGVVTDRDLRYATSRLHPAPFDPGARVEEAMAGDVVTATPLDPVEEAARLMFDRRIGCLPVLEGERLAGIVTVTDLLGAIIRLAGLGRPSSRLVLRLDDTPGKLAEVAAVVAERGLNVKSVLTYPEDDQHNRLILRVNTADTSALVERLRGRGFEVVWPEAQPWSR